MNQPNIVTSKTFRLHCAGIKLQRNTLFYFKCKVFRVFFLTCYHALVKAEDIFRTLHTVSKVKVDNSVNPRKSVKSKSSFLIHTPPPAKHSMFAAHFSKADRFQNFYNRIQSLSKIRYHIYYIYIK